jgi:hypothetical protein
VSFSPENEARRAPTGGNRLPDVVRRGDGGRPPPSRSPARGLVVLVVGILVVALVAGAVMLSRWYGDQAEGTSVFEDSVAAGSEPTVRLNNGRGQVRVEGGEGLEAVEITAKRYARGADPAAAAENAAGVDVDTSRDGSTVEISSDPGRGAGVDYALRVPVGARVEVESAAGDVEVLGLAGAVSTVAEAGDVAVRDVRGSVTVEAPQGDVTIEEMSTETGKATISTGSGDVTLGNLAVAILDARVEAGDVELTGRFSGGGQVYVETGSITVRLPPEDARELDLDARIGEVVREDAP